MFATWDSVILEREETKEGSKYMYIDVVLNAALSWITIYVKLQVYWSGGLLNKLEGVICKWSMCNI